jgi:hypothetical protein
VKFAKPHPGRPERPAQPPILYGAYLLAALSLTWSGYAITDLMHSGPFGLSVAIAGDVGWITVLWAEHQGITIRGRAWAAPASGWTIALAVAVLLVLHGTEQNNTAQAIAGPFVVLTGKAVWAFALASLRDPAALTAEQEAEIHAVMRDSEHAARMHRARLDGLDRTADATIEKILQEARVTAARDRADFEITLDRLEMRAEIARRSPLALTSAPTPHTADEPNAQPVEPAEPTAQLPAEPVEPPPPGATIVLASSHLAAPEPQAQPGEPETQPFGFSGSLSAQSAQRAEGVAKVAELLAQDPGLTSGQVAEELSVSPATAKRYLREARRDRT